MLNRICPVLVAMVVLLAGTPHGVADEPSPLTKADRAAFAWFDGIGLPSCAGKPYLRVRWLAAGADPKLPSRNELWELDGFLVAEADGRMTVLDGDLWPRKVERKGARGWTAEVLTLDLKEVVRAATSRLRAIVDDPGAVEPMDDLFRGIRLRFGDEAQALALARHAAANGLEKEAHDLLEAARALPPLPDAPAGATLPALAADQMHEAVIWRIVYDFSDASISRAALLARYRGWRKSFPDSPYVGRADVAVPVLERMVAEEAKRPALSDDAVASLPPAERVRALIDRLRDQTGDVYMTRSGRVSIDWGGRNTPAGRLLELGAVAVPALVEAVTDDRFTRAVLFIRDETFERQVVARVGDLARVVLERIEDKESWDVPQDAPSMFQHDAQQSVRDRWHSWLAPTQGLVARLTELAEETDPDRRAALAASFPDRGSGPIPGVEDATWGTKRFVAAVDGLDEDGARSLLRLLLEHASYSRTKTLAAWALLDLGERGVVADVAGLWRDLAEDARIDPEQGGTVISFLASCGDAAGIQALAEGLDERPAAVRELVVLAFGARGLGAVRGFAADPPAGVREPWPEDEAVLAAVEALLAGRLGDLEEDPLNRIPRQTPLCDMVPEYDCGRRIADAAIRVLARRWPRVYVLPDEPVRPKDTWEALRTKFLETWTSSRALENKR